MQPYLRVTAFLRIALVCLLIVVLGLLPYPLQTRAYSRQARAASAQQPAQAAAAYRELLALQPWRVELWEQVGALELAGGQIDAAITAFEQARARERLSSTGWLSLATAYTRAGQNDQALLLWQQHLHRFGPSAAVYGQMLATLRAAGNLEAAEPVVRDWQALEPSNARLTYLHGLLLLRGDPNRALNLLLQSAREEPSLSPGFEGLRKAAGQAAISADPAFGKVILGRALGNLGEWDLARLFFLDAVQLAPGYAEGWAFLGEARQNLGENGFADLEKAAALAPDSVTVQALLSVYWRRQGQPKQALSALEKIRRQEPDQIIWQIETGNTLAESGDLAAALPFFEQAVKMEPGHATPWLALASFSINYDVDVSGTGLPAARQALLLAPDDPLALDAMGLAFFKLSDLSSAERFLQRSLEQDSAQAATSLHLGQVYLHQNRLDLAYAPLATAVHLDENGAFGVLARRLLSMYYSAQP